MLLLWASLVVSLEWHMEWSGEKSYTILTRERRVFLATLGREQVLHLKEMSLATGR